MRRPSPLPLFQRKRVEWYGYRFLTSTVSLTWTAFTACSPVSLSPSAPFPMGRGIWCTACFHAHVVYRSARRIEDFARNDDTQKTAFPHSNPFLWKGLPPSAGRDTRILSGIPPVPYPALRATFPTRGRQAIRGYQSPATSHQSLVTPPTQKRKSRRRFPFLAVYRKDDFQRADHTSLLKSPHVLKRARVARSWEMRLFLTASSSTMTMTLSR